MLNAYESFVQELYEECLEEEARRLPNPVALRKEADAFLRDVLAKRTKEATVIPQGLEEVQNEVKLAFAEYREGMARLEAEEQEERAHEVRQRLNRTCDVIQKTAEQQKQQEKLAAMQKEAEEIAKDVQKVINEMHIMGRTSPEDIAIVSDMWVEEYPKTAEYFANLNKEQLEEIEKTAMMAKEAAKFVPAMRALMNRNPQAYKKFLESKGVTPTAKPTDTSFFTDMQSVKQNRGTVPQSRESNPAPWSREEIVANPNKVSDVIATRLGESSPIKIPETGKVVSPSALDYSPTDTAYRSFTGPTHVNANVPGTRVTALARDGKTPAKDVYVTPDPDVTKRHSPELTRGHSKLVGEFDNANLNPTVATTVKTPSGEIKSMPMWTSHIGNVEKSINQEYSRHNLKTIVNEIPETLQRNKTWTPEELQDLQNRIRRIDDSVETQGLHGGRLHEAVMKDFHDVQPRRLFRTNHYGDQLHELNIDNPVPNADYAKYLQALVEQYGVDRSKLLELIKNKQPAAW